MSPDIHNQLLSAFEKQENGDLKTAERLYKKILRQDKSNIHALNLLGLICANSGRGSEAVKLIGKAVQLNPNDHEAHYNLGLAHKENKDFKNAASAFSQSIRLEPRNPSSHHNLGLANYEMGKDETAIQHYNNALRINPNYVECLCVLSKAFLRSGNIDNAFTTAQKALQLSPTFAGGHFAMGEVLYKRSDFTQAIKAFEQTLKLDQDNDIAQIRLADALIGTSEIDKAQSFLSSVIEKNPNHVYAIQALGVLLEQLGKIDQAADAYKKAIKAAPDFSEVHYLLAQLRGRKVTDDEMRAMKSGFKRAKANSEIKQFFAFAMACAHEDRSEYESSLDYLKVGQSIIEGHAPYDDAVTAKQYGDIIKYFPEVKTRRNTEDACPIPIFIFGMPRSGTSLVEQILASHSEIVGRGETSFINDMASQAALLTGKIFPEFITHLTTDHVQTLRDTYLARLSENQGTPGYIVDKTPSNFKYLGLINAVMPEAILINCRRDPVDNSLSIFKIPFESQQTYAHNLTALGQHYLHYDTLMRHWESVFVDNMLVVHYEDNIVDQEKQARRMLSHIGLEFDEAVTRFYETDRIVKTPSASQVRQPIFTSSMKMGERYGDGIKELTDILQP